MSETVAVIDAEAVVRALAGRRFNLENEKRLQIEIELALRGVLDGFVYREHQLRWQNVAGGLVDYGIIDFVVVAHPGPGFVGVEVKIGGTAANIERQLRRYAKHPAISSLVLVTSKSVVLPPSIDGKPLYVVNLGRAWL